MSSLLQLKKLRQRRTGCRSLTWCVAADLGFQPRLSAPRTCGQNTRRHCLLRRRVLCLLLMNENIQPRVLRTVSGEPRRRTQTWPAPPAVPAPGNAFQGLPEEPAASTQAEGSGDSLRQPDLLRQSSGYRMSFCHHQRLPHQVTPHPWDSNRSSVPQPLGPEGVSCVCQPQKPQTPWCSELPCSAGRLSVLLLGL